MAQNIEDKLHNYATNWPKSKFEISSSEISEIVDILNEKDTKIKKLQLQVFQLKKTMGELDRDRV